MSLVVDLATKDSLLQYHYYSDDNFWVRKVGTDLVLKEAWEPYHIGELPPEYEEVYDDPNPKKETETEEDE